MHHCLFAVVMACLLAAAPRSSAQEKPQEIRGFAHQVDAKQGTITVNVPKGGGQQTFSLANAAVPVKDGRGGAMKLGDIKPGRKVTLTLARGADVAAIVVSPEFKVGTVVQVNNQTREIELQWKKEKLRFKIAKDAHYYRSERIVAPPELRVGHRVTLYYLPESNEVIVINYRDLAAGS